MGLFDFLKKNKNEIYSPVIGEVVHLENVSDPVFSQKILGEGVAVSPSSDDIFSPVDGTIVNLFETKHAFAIVNEAGAEILVHIGVDTVKLNGNHFNFSIKQGEKVSKGQKIGTADFKAIRDAGYDDITLLIITNTDTFKSVTPVAQGTKVTNESVVLDIK